MAEFEQHLTIEQLSAFLDGELSINEQETVEHHLALCERCQQHLANLRFTTQLLHSLPQPALPRSFALPLDTMVADPISAKITPITTRPTRVQHTTTVPAYLRPLRTLSTLAAVFGILFLLSAVLPFLLFSSRGASGSATTASTSNGSAAIPAKAPESKFDRDQLTQLAMNPHAIGKSPVPTIIPTTPPPVYQPAQPDTQPVDTSPPIIFSLLDLSTLQGRAIVGFLLLLLGILGLSFFRRPRRI